MTEPPAKRARTETDDDDTTCTSELGPLCLSTRREILRAIYGKLPPQLTMKCIERIPVARMINAYEIRTCVIEAGKARAMEIAETEAAAEQEHERQRVDIARCLERMVGGVADVDLVMGYVDGSDPRDGEAFVNVVFKVEFTLTKTRRRHTLEFNMQLVVTIDALGEVTRRAECEDVFQDLFEYNVLRPIGEIKRLVRKICVLLGLSHQVAKQIEPQFHAIKKSPEASSQ